MTRPTDSVRITHPACHISFLCSNAEKVTCVDNGFKAHIMTDYIIKSPFEALKELKNSKDEFFWESKVAIIKRRTALALY